MKNLKLQSGFFLFLVIFSAFAMISLNFLASMNSKIEPTTTNPIKASAYMWIDSILISEDSDRDALYPKIAVDGEGNVHIVWQDYSDIYQDDYADDIVYRKWDASLGAFSTITVISPASSTAAREPDIAVDSAGNVHVVWMDYMSNSDILYRMWNKSKNTWQGHSGAYDIVTPAESYACSYPAIAVDLSGNIHVVWSDENIFSPQDPDTTDDIYYKCWNASTRAWSSNRTLVSTESTGTSYNAWYPSVATDNQGNVHVVWEDYTNPFLGHSDSSYPDIFYKYRNATTGIWTTTELISNASTSYAYRPSIAADGLGNVHIVWYDYTNIFGSGANDYDIFYRMRDVATGTWSGHVNATDVISAGISATAQHPQVAATALGNVFVVWEQYYFDDISYNIVQRIWNATSHVWKPMEPVAQDDYDETSYPSVAVDVAGNSYVTWQKDYMYFSIYYRRSIITAPMTPILLPITPNPNPNLDNQLRWTSRMDATSYYIYKNTSLITSTTGLIPIAKISGSSYADVVSGNGTYYYAIVAENMNGNSSLSNCEGVTVVAVPGFHRLRIAQNSDFAKYGFAGNGSTITPWLIEDWYINGCGGNGIHISGTTDHFILRNNTVFNGINGIYLNTVTNGQVINNTAKFNKIGFNLTNSYGNFLYNNTASNNTDTLNAAGFSLYGSDNNWLSGNNVFNNKDTAGLGGSGFLLLYSDSNKLRYNRIHHNSGPGVYIESSLSNNITGNEIYSNKGTIGYANIGLYMEYGSSNNVIEANNIHDQYVGLQFQHPGSNVLIKNNTLHHNNVAIDMVVSSATGWMFSYNKFFSNGQAGDLWCGGATFYKNEVWNNTNGLYFWGAGGSILNSNTAWGNTNYGFNTNSAESMVFFDNTAIKNGYGFGIGGVDGITMNNNFAINNTNYGFSIGGILSEFNNNFVSGSNYGFYLSGAKNVSLRHNTIINNNYGVYLLNAKYVTIDSNEIRKNSQYGLYCGSSNHTMITWNTIGNSTRGVHLLKNINTTVRYNVISNNSNYGIYVENVNNSLITWNEILNNGAWISYKSGIKVTIEKNACFWGPYLNIISPNPAYDGWANLNWQDLPWATYYLVYRKSNAPIASFISLRTMTPIQNVTLNLAIDSTVPVLGIYYYIIVAGNATCWSTISNNQWVNITAYPRPAIPTLSTILPNISYNGQIKLDWNDAQNATRYYVYKHISPINMTNIGMLNAIAKVTQSSYTDNIFVNGTFHYAIIAGNTGFNSTVSNSESVLVQRQPIPGTPALSQIVPYPDNDGKIQLDWSDTISTVKYYVYRDTSFINSVFGRIPYKIVTESNYTDTVAVNATYYYVILAGNLGFNGSISVCRNVSVILYSNPDQPVLNPIIPGMDYDGIIKLDWTDTKSTTKYYVYRDIAFINNVNSLTPIATIIQSNYTNIVTANGTFYYVIVASNPSRNSSISNCRSVSVILYSIPSIPTLNPIQPNPDYDGTIHFNWTSATSASRYYVYRELSPITDIISLHPIAITSANTYIDVLSVNGTYYYAILAGNPGYNASACSNNQSVIISIVPRPGTPFLEPILPSYNGIVGLDWNDTINTMMYYIYKDTSIIVSINSRIPYAVVTESNYTDVIAVNGTFYYVIMAGNFGLNGSISNCRSVLVAIYPLPSTPTLNPIVPTINTYGIITLNWSDTANTVQYYIYKNNSLISELGALHPIATVNQSDYTYSEQIDGIYFYVIVAGNPSYNSSISNCESVTINLYNPPEPSILSPINPKLDYDGIVQLEWTDATNATKYYIFRDTSKITELAGRVPIAVVLQSSYTNELFINNTFYYVIVAGNAKFNSSISNCENVTIERYSVPTPPILYLIGSGMDYDGTIFLDWSDTASTIRYYVYKDIDNIDSVNSLAPLAVVTQSSYTEVLSINDTFYYVVVAGNLGFNSSISNCRSVTIEIYPAPSMPILNPIVPSTSYNGILHLSWSSATNTIKYFIYREVFLITNITPLTPLTQVTQPEYTDVISANQTYYYCIVAANPSHNSSMSNIRSATVAIYSVPPCPTFNLIVPNMDYDGTIYLEWSDTSSTSRYYIYREIFFITDVTLLIPKFVVTQSEYTDVIASNRTYYYAVLAGNPSRNSTISSCRDVIVTLYSPPSTPSLDQITPAISYDGKIQLEWTDTVSTSRYYIYRSMTNITSVSSLTPIAVVSQSDYLDVTNVNATFFYVVVAGNPTYNSTISQCWSVTVQLSGPSTPPGDNTWLIIVIVIGACAVAAALIVVKVRRKPQRAQVVSEQPTGVKAKLKGVKAEWKESLAIEDKVRALQRNIISIEELAELMDADLTNYFNQDFKPIPIKLIEFLQQLDAPPEDKMEILTEFSNLTDQQKQEYLKELTEI